MEHVRRSLQLTKKALSVALYLDSYHFFSCIAHNGKLYFPFHNLTTHLLLIVNQPLLVQLLATYIFHHRLIVWTNVIEDPCAHTQEKDNLAEHGSSVTTLASGKGRKE